MHNTALALKPPRAGRLRVCGGPFLLPVGRGGGQDVFIRKAHALAEQGTASRRFC